MRKKSQKGRRKKLALSLRHEFNEIIIQAIDCNGTIYDLDVKLHEVFINSGVKPISKKGSASLEVRLSTDKFEIY